MAGSIAGCTEGTADAPAATCGACTCGGGGGGGGASTPPHCCRAPAPLFRKPADADARASFAACKTAWRSK